jgi:N-acetylglucosaminyl-diphospho-decaprenol L-rhamnosyltransferase
MKDGNQNYAVLTSVLIVGYKSCSYIAQCLNGLFCSIAGEDIEVLFIDCSNDGADIIVKERFPTVRVFEFQGNLGFARANNLLASHAHGQNLLLLNPDTLPANRNVAKLIEFSRANPDACAWGGLTRLPSGQIDGGSVQPMLSALSLSLSLVGLGSKYLKSANPAITGRQRVPVLTGAFMLINAAKWKEISGFDERFFMYAEEVDLCKRLNDTNGVLLLDASIEMIHDTGSGERRTAQRFINRARGNATFFNKHFSATAAWGCKTLMLIHAFTRALAWLLRRNRASANAFWQIFKCRSQWWNGWPQQDRSQ